MKKEPLKNKIKEVCFDCLENNTSGRYYLEEHLQSAVEWLKEEFEKRRTIDLPSDELNLILSTINKAFPDLQDSEKTRQ